MWTYLSQTSAELPPKNGGVRKANWYRLGIIGAPILATDTVTVNVLLKVVVLPPLQHNLTCHPEFFVTGRHFEQRNGSCLTTSCQIAKFVVSVQ